MNSRIQKLGMALLVITTQQVSYGAASASMPQEPNDTAAYYAELKNDLNAPYYRYDLQVKRAILKPTAQEHAALVAMARQKQDQQVLTHLQTHGARTQHPLIEAYELSIAFAKNHKIEIGSVVLASTLAYRIGIKRGHSAGYNKGYDVGNRIGFTEGRKGQCKVQYYEKSSKQFLPCSCGLTHQVCSPVEAISYGKSVKRCKGL